MYKIVHEPAACEALLRSVPDPPQALKSVLFLLNVIILIGGSKSNSDGKLKGPGTGTSVSV